MAGYYDLIAEIKEPDEGSPAVTIMIGNISVDVVPAVRLMEWPKSAKDWQSSWLDTDKIMKTGPTGSCAVAKIHKTGR